MAQTSVKEKICNACGAEVRPKAGFCYNCGSAVAPDIPLAENNHQSKDDKWVSDNPVEKDLKEKSFEKNGREKDLTVNENIGEKINLQTEETISDNENQEKRDLSNMKSAASMRRRGKSVQKKKVEIVWEEHDNAPNGWFIFFAVILVVLAVTIWILSTYLE